MPGAYTHLTVANLAREPARLESGPGISGAAGLALGRWFKYCELGAVSPDYPYLAVGNSGAAKWADLMHYERTGDMVKAGVQVVSKLVGPAKEKAFAWLAGYTAHVIADVTIHPVVERKVGPYAENKKAHRVCEMHQDAYIFGRLNLGGIGLSEHLDSGINQCSDGNGGIDPVIAEAWREMLRICHPEEFSDNSPDIDAWHRGFRTMVDTIAEEGNRLMPIARHVAVNCGFTYPTSGDVDLSEYIQDIQTPLGRIHYDGVVDKALTHVVEGWHLIAAGVFDGGNGYQQAFGRWNLDTGRDGDGNYVLWG